MIAGSVPVRWSSASPGETGRTVVELSRDRGKSWAGIYSSTSPDTSFDWNTVHVADGTGFLFRVSLLGDTTYGFAQMAGRFTVNNPGNGVPEAGVVSPDSGQAITGKGTVAWWAEDADGDPLTIAIDASPDNGRTWEHLADQPNTGSYSWNTPGSPNSPAYRVRVRGSDAAANGTSGLRAVLPVQLASFAPEVPGPTHFRERRRDRPGPRRRPVETHRPHLSCVVPRQRPGVESVQRHRPGPERHRPSQGPRSPHRTPKGPSLTDSVWSSKIVIPRDCRRIRHGGSREGAT